WNLVTPPELTRDAPILDVIEPLVISVDPVFRHELDLTRGDYIQRFLRDALAIRRRLAHGDEPLIGQHGLDDDTSTIATWHLELVLLDFFQETLGFEIGDDLLAGGKALKSLVLF